MFSIKCPHCESEYEIERSEYGRTVPCEVCGKMFVIGGAFSSAPSLNPASRRIKQIRYAPLRRVENVPSQVSNGVNSDQYNGRQTAVVDVQKSSRRKHIELPKTYKDTHFITEWLIKARYWIACFFVFGVAAVILIAFNRAEMEADVRWIVRGVCVVVAFVLWMRARMWYEKEIIKFESIKHQRESRDVQKQTLDVQQLTREQALDVQRQILDVLKGGGRAILAVDSGGLAVSQQRSQRDLDRVRNTSNQDGADESNEIRALEAVFKTIQSVRSVMLCVRMGQDIKVLRANGHDQNERIRND